MMNIKSGNNLLDGFFVKAESLGLELLTDDKKWLKKVCMDAPSAKLSTLLEQYTEHWLSSMAAESIEHKKQNVGRFSANAFLREELGEKIGH